jgi:flagellar basal-body rod modification protein FlgD
MDIVNAGMIESLQVDPEERGQKMGEAGGAMGKDQFMNLLITQMQNQDPLEPVDNKEMIAQLAQFSSLEQMQNLNSKFETFQKNTTAAISSLLVGKTGQINNGGFSSEGLIDRVVQDGDEIKVNIDGTDYSLDQLANIFE